MSTRDPWADPETRTEPGAPYAGPPATAPPGYGWAPPGYGSWAPPGYGYPSAWPVAPRRPRRPGQVIAAAVLAFVQAAMVLVGSLYVWFAASLVEVATSNVPGTFDASTAQELATEGAILSAVQVISAILLIAAGVMALNLRSRLTWLLLVVAHAVQVVLSGYWLVRLLMLAGDASDPEIGGVFTVFTLFFAAGPLVGLGLVSFGPGRRWFGDGAQA